MTKMTRYKLADANEFLPSIPAVWNNALKKHKGIEASNGAEYAGSTLLATSDIHNRNKFSRMIAAAFDQVKLGALLVEVVNDAGKSSPIALIIPHKKKFEAKSRFTLVVRSFGSKSHKKAVFDEMTTGRIVKELPNMCQLNLYAIPTSSKPIKRARKTVDKKAS